MKPLKKILKWTGIALGILLVAFGFYFFRKIHIPEPDITSELRPDDLERVRVAENHYRVKENHLIKNRYGVWEMYLKGKDYDRGVIYGVLAEELIEKQEAAFVGKIEEIISNPFYLRFLKYFVAWFNRDIDQYIPEEYLKEIYGISLSFSGKYDYVAPKYYRILNYHAAHDIGHALNDYNMVGCSSFAAGGAYTEDNSLLLARNFDFYMGKEFAEDKLILFMEPDKGNKYISYSWAGFMGVVSGMNEKGLTVTINAAKSDIPPGAKMPISLLAREILQYAETLDEALAIAKQRHTFVSESILIGSAEDRKAIVIEKSPSGIDVYKVEEDLLVCTNHYQSDFFKNKPVVKEDIQKSDSKYRYDRILELTEKKRPLTPETAVNILRDQHGTGGKHIGYGNPKALNQLIAHHGVVFKPEERKVWFSTPPYQLGEFICYDLSSVFKKGERGPVDSLTIEEDPFLQSEDYKKYKRFLSVKQQILSYTLTGHPLELSKEDIGQFISSNPESYVTYMALGDYHREREDHQKAIEAYRTSLTKELASQHEKEKIESLIEECEKAMEK